MTPALTFCISRFQRPTVFCKASKNSKSSALAPQSMSYPMHCTREAILLGAKVRHLGLAAVLLGLFNHLLDQGVRQQHDLRDVCVLLQVRQRHLKVAEGFGQAFDSCTVGRQPRQRHSSKASVTVAQNAGNRPAHGMWVVSSRTDKSCPHALVAKSNEAQG